MVDRPSSETDSVQPAAGQALRPWSEGLRLEALANLAHELRTPLQVLLGYLDILRDEWADKFDQEPREMLERMNTNLHDLAHTVDNIMEFVMAEANSKVRVQEEVTVSSLVTDLTPAIEAAKSGKELTLKFDLDDAPAVLRISRRPLRSILSNLVLNAIKFTDQGSVTVKISRARARGAERGVDIEVADTGLGISAAQIKQAAQPFAQLSHSNARKFRGLGLGLAVVHRNVQAIGAKLEVSSTPGRGSRFVVRIPPAHLMAAEAVTKQVGVSRQAHAAEPIRQPPAGPSRKAVGGAADPLMLI